MRKVRLILLVVALATVLTAGSAFAAGVIGTPHDVSSYIIGSAGACSVCHVPHKSVGARLWAADMDTSGTPTGVVGPLCSSCHELAGGYTTLVNANAASYTVYNAAAHGLFANSGYVMEGGTKDDINDYGGAANPALPYTLAADRISNQIQCTSCHNVHDNAEARPFLRQNIRDLCIQCHGDRYSNDGVNLVANGALTTWGGGYGPYNIGSHPVGTDVTGEMETNSSLYDSPITAWTDPPFDGITGSLMQLFDNTSSDGDDADWGGAGNQGRWNLGLHTATSADIAPGNGQDGGVVCVSCHAIHGVQADNTAEDGAGGVQVVPTTNLLARIQSEAAAALGSSVANGDGDGRNNLCEICHCDSTWDGSAFTMNDGSAYTGPNRPNPGEETYSHPMDDAVAVYTAVNSFPSDWPKGENSGTPNAADPNPICESCHVPHPARALLNNRPDVIDPVNTWNGATGTPGAGQYILRSSATGICSECHLGSVEFHHPIGTMVNVVTVSTPWSTGLAGSDDKIGDTDGVLTCGDCHSLPGAHNWTGPKQIGMDPDWVPYNNGRPSDGTDTMLAELPLSVGMSATCELCHYMLRTGSYTLATTPTHDAIDDWDKSDHVGGGGSEEYQKNGVGTHFLGGVSPGFDWANGSIDNGDNTFDARYEVWDNLNPIGKGWSRWGTATEGEHLVCESCHELEPDKNENGSKLLLYWFAEDANNPGRGGNDGDNFDTSKFCEGCHTANGPLNTHPMTNDTVSKTGNLLTTQNRCATGTTPSFLQLISMQAPAGRPNGGGVNGYTTFPDANKMNCDSCHQVHDANTNSRTYILDAPEAYTDLGAVTSGGDDGQGNFERSLLIHGSPDAGLKHPLGNTDVANGTPDFDYTSFCDQCHNYTYNLCP
jgi:predicted CXXCH cytochrome family protein